MKILRMRNRWIGLAFAWLSAYSASGQSYTISTFAGGGLPISLPGASASLGYVGSVAVDPEGNIVFSLRDLAAVIRLDGSTGILSVAAGNGAPGYGGDNGAATDAQLSQPSGLAFDAAGSLYIADSVNNRIRKVANGVITTVVGTGAAGYSGDNGPATSATLSYPAGVAVDASGDLYIADRGNNCIRKVSSGVITTVAGTGTAGYGGDNGPAPRATLNSPTGVAVDAAGNLYIADTSNQSIRMVSKGVIVTVAGSGVAGYSGDNGPAASAALNSPTGVAVDTAGTLYIADSANYRIRQVADSVITTVAGSTPGFGGDNGPATSARLSNPNGLAVDATGDLYIADSLNYRVRKVTAGVINTVAGNGAKGGSGDNGPATAALLVQPNSVAVDTAGNLYLTEPGANRVRKISRGVITTVAGIGSQGHSGDNGPATSAQLAEPWGVAVDAAGNFYIADISDSYVRKVSNGIITTVAGTGNFGFNGDDGPAASAELDGPMGVAVDAAGNLYIADTGNNRVRKVSNGIITTVAGTGTGGYTGDGGPAASAQLHGPAGLAFDAAGNLYIADEFNDRIRKITNGVITTVAGNGTRGYNSGDGGLATSAELYLPGSVAVDATGNIYIADEFSERVLEVSNGVITTVAGDGTSGFSGDGGPGTSAQLGGPAGVTVDAAGNVYIADAINNRVRLLTPGVPACGYSISPSPVYAPEAGGNLTVRIQTAAGCAWSVSGLPSWLTISSPTSGSGPATVTLVASANPLASRSATVSVAGVTVSVEQPSGAFGITTSASLPSGFYGGAYSQTLTAAGGAPPYMWSVVSGTLPLGLTLSPFGSITGTPSSAGSSTFKIQVTDSTTAVATQSFALTVIGVGALSRAGVLSQIVSNGGWKTSVSLVNTGSSAVAVRLVVHADDGTVLSLPIAVTLQGTTQTPTANTVDAVINPDATLLVETTSQTGVATEGWVDVLSSGPVNGFGIFRYAYSDSSASEGTVPLEAQPPSTLDLPYDNIAGYVTGVALANLGPAATTVTATIWDADGTQLAVQSIALPGNGHTSFVLTDRFPVTAGQKGLIQFQSPAGLGGLGLRFSPFSTFTSVPTITP